MNIIEALKRSKEAGGWYYHRQRSEISGGTIVQIRWTEEDDEHTDLAAGDILANDWEPVPHLAEKSVMANGEPVSCPIAKEGSDERERVDGGH